MLRQVAKTSPTQSFLLALSREGALRPFYLLAESFRSSSEYCVVATGIFSLLKSARAECPTLRF
jgi:hypothetical protein